MRSSPLYSSVVSVLLAAAMPAYADSPSPIDRSIHPVTLAVIGDTPYGETQIADFPNLVSHINADPDVQWVAHLGDIKNGSTRCDDSHYQFIAAQFGSFEDSLMYTPGDNEWTDCHRTSNGKYDPLDRLALVRELFFADPEQSLGGKARPLFSQATTPGYEALPENQSFIAARVVFSTLHVVGSRNDLAPWFTDDPNDDLVDDPARRLAENELRTQAAVDWVDQTFDRAEFPTTAGVVLMMQADTWPGSAADGFAAILQRIAERASTFEKPVLVLQGDSHTYKVDQPLLEGDPIHGIDFAVPNLTRLVVQGETTSEWLKLRVDPKASELFSWERIAR